jgi:hypothetical protein
VSNANGSNVVSLPPRDRASSLIESGLQACATVWERRAFLRYLLDAAAEARTAEEPVEVVRRDLLSLQIRLPFAAHPARDHSFADLNDPVDS